MTTLLPHNLQPRVVAILGWAILLVMTAGCASMRSSEPLFAPILLPGQSPDAATEDLPVTLHFWEDLLVHGYQRTVSVIAPGADQPLRTLRLPSEVQAMAATPDGHLWIGTKQGLYHLASPNAEPVPLELPNLPGFAPKQHVSALAVDAAGALWVADYHTGVFRFDAASGHWQEMLKAFPVTAIARGVGAEMWVGSYVGLFHHNAEGWTRYAEEGTTHHGIPDNFVDHLVDDRGGLLWVLMSEAIGHLPSGLEGASAQEEMEEIAYLGDRENRIYDVVALDGGSRLFTSRQGPIYLRDLPEAPQDGLHEIGVRRYRAAVPVPVSALGIPDHWSADTNPLQVLYRDGLLVFASTRAVWSRREADLLAAPGLDP